MGLKFYQLGHQRAPASVISYHFVSGRERERKKKAKKLLYIKLITDDVKRPLPHCTVPTLPLLTPPPTPPPSLLPLLSLCVCAWLSSNMHDEVRGGVLRAVLLSSLSCSSACGDSVCLGALHPPPSLPTPPQPPSPQLNIPVTPLHPVSLFNVVQCLYEEPV